MSDSTPCHVLFMGNGWGLMTIVASKRQDLVPNGDALGNSQLSAIGWVGAGVSISMKSLGLPALFRALRRVIVGGGSWHGSLLLDLPKLKLSSRGLVASSS